MLSADNFQIDHFLIIPSKNRIESKEEAVSITSKMMAVLCLLAETPGETVNKSTILDSVWADVSVSEAVLTRAIADLRKAFGESAKSSQLIQTIPKKGYCLNAKVVWQDNISGLPSLKHSIPNLSSIDEMVVSRQNNVLLKILMFSGLLVALVSAVVWLNSVNRLEASAAYFPLRLTADDNAFEQQPRFAGQGNQVLFVERRRGETGVVLQDIVNQTSHTILNSTNAIRSATLSPDQTRLAFFEFVDGQCTLQVTELLHFARIHSQPCLSEHSQSLDWSPDGLSLLTTRYDANKRVEGVVEINLESKKIQTIKTPDAPQSGILFPRFSADGQSIAALLYQPSAGTWQVVVINKNTARTEYYATEYNFINQVVWGKNDSSIYYVVASGDRAGIWKTELSSRANTLLIAAEVIDMDYSANKNAFVVIEEKRDVDIWQFDFESKMNTKISTSSTIDHQPAIAPNNYLLAYASNQSNVFNIWLNDLNQKSTVQMSFFKQGQIMDLRWHPQQPLLYFSRIDQGRSSIWQVDLNKQMTKISPQNQNEKFLDWSADGTRYYALVEKDNQWQVIENDLKNNRQIIILNEPVKRLRSYQDKLLYTQYHDSRIKMLTLSNSGEEQTESIMIYDDVFAWDLSTDSIGYITLNQKKSLSLYKYDLLSGLSQEISFIELAPSVSQRGMSVANNFSQLFYTKADRQSRDVILYRELERKEK